MDGMYTIEEMTDSIIKEFSLVDPVKNRRTYYQKIRRSLENAGLIDKGIVMVNPQTRRKCMYYTEFHRLTILAEKSLYDYVRKNSADDKYKKAPRFKEIQKQIDEQRQVYIDHLSTQTMSGTTDSDPYVSDEEVKAKKHGMMLEALFNVFFTPFNEDLLKNDMERMLVADDMHLEFADIEAHDRLEHPEGVYFNRKNLDGSDSQP